MFRGGFPGFFSGDMDEDQPTSKQIDNTSLYKELELTPKATPDEIRKAYKALTLKHHPDRPGGNAEKFKKIKQANDILSDAKKRELYDRFGMEGVQSGGRSSGMDLFDLLSGRGGQRQRGPPKNKPKLVQLDCTLQQIYSGCMKKLTHKRARVCTQCDGKGGKNVKKCTQCKGRGVIEKLVQLGPGMYTKSQAHCPQCRGEGEISDPKDKCKKCNGQKIIISQKVLQVGVEAGCPQGHDYIFTGESDQFPGTLAGDLYVRIKFLEHSHFKRRGADLFFKHKISLLEALTGVGIALTHLDGKSIQIGSFDGDVIKHEEIKKVQGLGMPYYKDPMHYGNLYIEFELQFPAKGQITPQKADLLKKILPASKPEKLAAGISQDDTHLLQDYDQNQTNPNPQGGKADFEEEDDEMRGGGQRVQCSQQ